METTATNELPPQAPVIAQLLDRKRQAGEPIEIVFSDRDGCWEVSHAGIINVGVTEASTTIFNEGLAENRPTVLVTGRPVAETIREIEAGGLEPFAVVIGAAGTDIANRMPNGSYQRDEGYRELLRGKFDRTAVVGRGAMLVDGFGQSMPDIHLRFQDPENEEGFLAGDAPRSVEEFKVSFDFTTVNTAETLPAVRAAFEATYPNLHVVISEEARYPAGHPEGLKKFYLDILPATKKDAIVYIMNTYGAELGYFQGDSGNDVEGIVGTPNNVIGVLVAGYRDEAGEAVKATLAGGDARIAMFQRLKNADGSTGNKLVFVDDDPERRGSQSLLYILRTMGNTALRRAVMAILSPERPSAS